MEFFIKYTGYSEQRNLLYYDEEFSFDMEPRTSDIDFEIVITTCNFMHTLTLAVVNGKIIQLDGYCGLTKKMEANYIVPQSQKGELRVLNPEKYWDTAGSYGINKEKWPVYVNIQTGWICIGDPNKSENAVEFINNCISVIDNNKNLVSVWLKPAKLPKLTLP